MILFFSILLGNAKGSQMATIAIFSAKMNMMPSLVNDAIKAVIDYKKELSAIRTKALTIDPSVCNLDDVISSIQASTKIQEQKIDSLTALHNRTEQFISDVVRIDQNVAELIRLRKKEFYNAHPNLKPESEKTGWEKFTDGCASVGQWCKEHWKLIVTVVLVIAAIVIIVFFPAAAPLLLLIAKGVLMGAAIGGLAGGAMSALSGGSFWEGFENGAFAGAIAGGISGGMGQLFALANVAAGGTAALSLGQTLLIGGVSGMGSSLLSDLGDIFIKGEDKSFGQVLLNMGISGLLGAAFAGVFYGLSKGFSALKVKLNGNPNSGKVKFAPPKNNATPENVAQTKAYVDGCNDAMKDGALSSTGRVSTTGTLRTEASRAAAVERATAAAAGNPYTGHVGHVPDTTWTGTAQPHSWLDLNPSVNMSLGAQALKYPIGFQPTGFVYNNPFEFNLFSAPSSWSSPFGSLFGKSLGELVTD